jgi:hypothetical protein
MWLCWKTRVLKLPGNVAFSWKYAGGNWNGFNNWQAEVSGLNLKCAWPNGAWSLRDIS